MSDKKIMSYSEQSKKQWGRNPEKFNSNSELTVEEIKTGCLQRMATAFESMADDLHFIRTNVDYSQNQIDRLRRQNTQLRSKLKKSENKLK